MTNQEAIDLLDNLIGMIEDNHGSDYDSAIRMAIDALEPQWIPCSERLPVICEYDVNGQKTFSCRVLSTQVYGNGLVFVGSDRYTSDRGWLSEVLDENGAPESKVIAWMPLPEPWKEEE